MGSLFSKPKVPTPPPPPPPSTIRDEIAGVEQVPVSNPDGTITYVTKKLPLTAEQQAEQDKFDKIMADALGEIERLSSADYDADTQTKQVLDDWRNQKVETLNEGFDERAALEAQNLARRGLSNSSAAAAARRQLSLDKQNAFEQVNREQRLMEDNVRQQQLGLQQNLYSIAANRNDLTAAQSFQAAARGQNQLLANEQARQSSILQYYNYQQQAANQPSLFGQMLPTIGALAGGAVGGPAGAYAGGSLGTLFSPHI